MPRRGEHPRQSERRMDISRHARGVPQKLRLLIEGVHTVVTTWFQGWSGLANGELLNAAEEAGFELFITADQESKYQQNLKGRQMALGVLSTNNWGLI